MFGTSDILIEAIHSQSDIRLGYASYVAKQ